MATIKPFSVAVADALNNGGKGVWLGRDNLGWVFLDRTLSCNQPSGSEYLFIRGSDWSAYWGGAASWKGDGAYVYYSKYLAGLQGDTKVTGIATVEALCAEYLARAQALRNEMQQLIDQRWPKQEKGLAAVKAEQGESERIAIEEARAVAEEAIKHRHEKRIERLKSLMLEAQDRESERIQKFIRDHRVRYLYHFTSTMNLDGIMTHGVLPRSEITDGFRWNDACRYDGFLEAACLSAGYINYKMFWYCYFQSQDVRNWALVAISPDILRDTPCLFFSTNAPNGRFHHLGNEALASHMGLKGLTDMYFDEPPGLRAERSLKDFWTTDPQAEILAFGRIPVTRIEAVALLRPEEQLEKTLRSLQPRWRIGTAPEMFEKRHDYKFWQAGEGVRLSKDTSFLDDIPF